MMGGVAAVPTSPDHDRFGRGVVRLDLAGTALFTVVSALGVAVDALRAPAAIVAVVLFAVGIAAFIWSYVSALERSRTEEVGVANLYLLTGATAPQAVKRTMLGALSVQVVVCVAAAGAGFSQITASESNPLAFGILVPMFGLGLDGLWASRLGAFGPRILTTTGTTTTPRPAPDPEQTSRHG